MKFSVIVPIYNIEKYLDKCIESILSQDYKNFELILVNDGSSDDSLSICQKHFEVDKRVRIINKPNGGLTSARKAGARVANGEYVICIDGDDYIEQGYFSCVASSLEKHCADILVFNYYSLEGGNKILHKNKYLDSLLFGKSYESIKDRFVYDSTDKNISNAGTIPYPLWAKVIKRDIYVKAQELVNDLIVIGEDMMCSLYCLQFSKSIYCLNESYYVYRILNNSMMHKYNIRKFEHFDNTVKELINSELIDKQRIYAYSFHAICNEFARLAESVNSLSSFKENVRQSHRFKLLYETAGKVDVSNSDYLSKLKFYLVNNKRYELLYLLLKIKNR